jgi:integrase
LTLILQHPWFTGCESSKRIHEPGDFHLSGAHYWAPILAMHTGCRAGELGGLRIDEIRLDHRHPHIVVQDNIYRTTKGSYRRRVPILDVLLEHGFGDFVERQASAGHDRLFDDWEPPAGKVDANATAWSNSRIIRSFNRTVVRQQLGSLLVPGARQEVTFHGFRGAFKTLLTRPEYHLNPNYIHEVVGHAKLGLDQRYIGEIPLEDTYPAVRGCRYQGLMLPPAPAPG